MSVGKLDDITHSSSCGSHWECIWFQCAAAKLIQRPHIVNRPQLLIQTGRSGTGSLNTPNGINGATTDARVVAGSSA